MHAGTRGAGEIQLLHSIPVEIRNRRIRKAPAAEPHSKRIDRPLIEQIGSAGAFKFEDAEPVEPNRRDVRGRNVMANVVFISRVQHLAARRRKELRHALLRGEYHGIPLPAFRNGAAVIKSRIRIDHCPFLKAEHFAAFLSMEAIDFFF